MGKNKGKKTTFSKLQISFDGSSNGLADPATINGADKQTCLNAILDDSPSVSISLGAEDTCSEHTESSMEGYDSLIEKESKSAHRVFDNLPERNFSASVDSAAATIVPPIWAEKVSNSHQINEGLEFDDEEVILHSSQLLSLENAWGHCFIGFFAGRYPGFLALQNIMNSWDVQCKFFKHDSGWIVFKFQSADDRDKVLQAGPYFAYGSTLVTKSMPACFEFDTFEDLSIVPVWIKLCGLPVDLWSKKGLSKIVSRVGTPIATDSFTRSRERVSFARVLVEVDASKELVKSIKMKLPNGKTRIQTVDYEFIPKFCTKCNALGHKTDGCKAYLLALAVANENPKQKGGRQNKGKTQAKDDATGTIDTVPVHPIDPVRPVGPISWPLLPTPTYDEPVSSPRRSGLDSSMAAPSRLGADCTVPSSSTSGDFVPIEPRFEQIQKRGKKHTKKKDKGRDKILPISS